MIDCHTDVILCMSFNTDGSLLTTTCKDKKLRVIEPRSGRVLQVEPYDLLRGRRFWSLWRNWAVLGPCSCISPMLQASLWAQGHSQSVGSLICMDRKEPDDSYHSDISSKGDSSACAMDLQSLSPWG